MKMISRFNKMPFMKMFRRKKNNKGVVWASILSLAVSTVVMFLSKGQKKIKLNPALQNFAQNISTKNNFPMMNDAALTEFSEELVTKAVQDNSTSEEFIQKAVQDNNTSEEFIQKAVQENNTSSEEFAQNAFQNKDYQ